MYDAATRALYSDLFKGAEADLRPKLAEVLKKFDDLFLKGEKKRKDHKEA